jgi:hypothetical protein
MTVQAKDIPDEAREAFTEAWNAGFTLDICLAAALNAWPKGYISEGAGKTEFIILPLEQPSKETDWGEPQGIEVW